jgi:hypothetical protein
VALSPTLPAANPSSLERSALQRPAKLFTLWHLTSLDAPTVAVTWCLAFAFSARVQLPIWLSFVLALATWAFYIGDRLLDGYRALLRSDAALLRDRHRFHWQHRRIFLPLAIASSFAVLALALHFMPIAARPRNTVLAAAAFAYFSSVHSPAGFPFPRLRRALRIPKEPLVGLIFAAACALPAWSRISAGRLSFLPLVLVFAALAALNCEAIETWESAPGWPTGTVRIARWSFLLALASLLLASVAAFLHHPRYAALLIAATASSLAIAMLDRYRRQMHPTTLRAAVDLILLTPLAVFLVP